MEDFFDQYGDFLLAILAGSLFFVFVMNLLMQNGILFEAINAFETTICTKLVSFPRGGMLK